MSRVYYFCHHKFSFFLFCIFNFLISDYPCSSTNLLLQNVKERSLPIDFADKMGGEGNSPIDLIDKVATEQDVRRLVAPRKHSNPPGKLCPENFYSVNSVPNIFRFECFFPNSENIIVGVVPYDCDRMVLLLRNIFLLTCSKYVPPENLTELFATVHNCICTSKHNTTVGEKKDIKLRFFPPRKPKKIHAIIYIIIILDQQLVYVTPRPLQLKVRFLWGF